jgi:tRNA nucleotidyltransferase (CCA-adding enzyme)
LAYNTDRDLVTRLSILFHDIGKPHCYTEDELGGHFKGHGPIGVTLTDTVLHRLRFDNDTTARVVRLVDYHDRAIPAEPKSVKRLMQKMPDEDILRLMEVQRCDRMAHAKDYCTPSPALVEIPKLMRQIREADECISLKSLAVNGDDLIALGVPRGKQIGAILATLLDAVIDGTLPNDRTALLAYLRKEL